MWRERIRETDEGSWACFSPGPAFPSVKWDTGLRGPLVLSLDSWVWADKMGNGSGCAKAQRLARPTVISLFVSPSSKDPCLPHPCWIWDALLLGSLLLRPGQCARVTVRVHAYACAGGGVGKEFVKHTELPP